MTRWLDVVAESRRTWPIWPDATVVEPPIRRALTGRFSYQAFSDRVRVLAFAHTSRRPFYWSDRAWS